jgi:hypothetical protein
MSPQVEIALDGINEILHIDACVTVRGDELKIWTHDEEGGGRSKDYMNAADIDRLIGHLTTVRDSLVSP